MKVWLVVLAGILNLLAFVSCQREVEETLLPTETTDNVYLSKMVWVDTTLPTGTDTVDRFFFEYDNAKRLTRMREYFSNPFQNDTVISHYEYTGNDTLPYRAIIQANHNYLSGPSKSADTIYFFYSSGYVQRDSVVSWNSLNNTSRGARVADYSFSGTTITKTRRYYNLVNGAYVFDFAEVFVYTVASSNGNLVAENRVSGPGEFVFVQASYDIKINPIAAVYKIKYRDFDQGNSYYFNSWSVQKNNPVAIQYQDDPYPVANENYTYTYRADNRPSAARLSINAGFGSYNKAFFYYTSL